MADLVRSLACPITSVRNTVIFLIFMFLNTFWYLFLPLLLVNGYLVKLIRAVVQKNDMPDWPGYNWLEWGYLLKHGLAYTFVLLVYITVPFLIMYLSTAFRFSFLLILLSLLIFIMVAFILPMALAYYAATENLAEAFNFPEILGIIFRSLKQYLQVYLVSAVLFITALVVSFMFPLFAGLALAYPLFFAMHAFSQILAESQ